MDRVPDPECYPSALVLSMQAPTPAVVGGLVAGTAGWTDRTLIASGRFYPRGIRKSSERLQYYASQFSMVEVDATYYALIPAETTQHWVRSTPAGFRFNIKAHPVLTGHPMELERLPKDLHRDLGPFSRRGRVYADRLPKELASDIENRFRSTLQPLTQSGKLSCVLTQFPPWFEATRGNARRIERLAQRWEGVTLAVEFRHPSWLDPVRRDRVMSLLKNHQMAYVCVDEPQLEGSGVPPALEVTFPRLAYLRFHGHNLRGWATQGASVHQRFDYLYSTEELARWARPASSLAAQAEEVHAVFNNCVRDYAVLGAKGLMALVNASRRNLSNIG